MPYGHGQHICFFYDTQEEQLAVAVAYVTDGLNKGEQSLYVADSEKELDHFRIGLERSGVDVVGAESRGALLLRTKRQAHLIGGCFDCERMLKMLNAAVEDALNAGFSGLRTCGDMTWLVDEPPGSDQIVEYEAVLNAFFRQTRGLGMCQYDLKRLPVAVLDHAGLCAHSTVVVNGEHKNNMFYRPTHPNRMPTDAALLDAKLERLRSGA